MAATKTTASRHTMFTFTHGHIFMPMGRTARDLSEVIIPQRLSICLAGKGCKVPYMPTQSLSKELKSERYQPVEIDLKNKNSSHSLTIELTGRNKRVLEIGTSTGYITKVLKEQGNQVIGIEIDKDAADMARQYCESMIIGDVEELDLDAYLDPESFNVILLADILEHLRWPGSLLSRIKKYLKADGYLVVSLPNVAHGDVLLNLLNGDFKYKSVGLLDETHLRFFGRKNVINIFNNFGYNIEELQETKMPLGSTDLGMDLSKIPSIFVKLISSLPDSEVYQFVLKAVPSANINNEEIPDVDFSEVVSTAIEDIMMQHQSEIESISSQLKQADDRANAIDQRASQFQKEVEERDRQIASISEKREEADGQANALRHEIAEIKKSMSWKLTQKFHNGFVERVLPQGSRRRRYYDLGLKAGRIMANDGLKPAISTSVDYLKTHKSALATEAKSAYYAKDDEEKNDIKEQYIMDLFDRAGQKSPEYVPLSKSHITLSEADIKLIAFYLPQYHPIPENDEWWGRGFTDWTNVSKAVPQFVGHYQPHLPDELGFYDLRLIEVQKRQIELAKQYGIYGFCFHYYWFNGKRLLEKPLDQFLNNPELDFPFCICWANENWTRRWDGMENEILIAQTHSPENDVAFIKDILPLFRDPRYIRINNRPILIVYRIPLLPDAKATAERWRAYCRECGIGDPYLIAAQTFGLKDPSAYGFDAAVEFPPHTMQGCNSLNKIEVINPDFAGQIWDYDGFVKTKHYLERAPYKLFKTVMPGWDNTPRKPDNGSIFHGANPANYKEWLWNVAKWTKEVHRPEERIIFINAMNEWAESAHLEPDRRYGYGYLQSTLEIVRDYHKNFIKTE